MKNLTITMTLALLSAPIASMAEVKSMSVESFKDLDGSRYWEVAVKCHSDSTERLMQRVVGKGNKWCSAANTGLCNDSKLELSRDICAAEALSKKSSNRDNTIVASETKNEESVGTLLASASEDKESQRTELMRQQVQIEEQRILIEQRRLSLVQAELRLKQQQN